MKFNNKIERFFPRFIIEKSDIPSIFIDTFMWRKILKNDEIKQLLIDNCRDAKLLILTNYLQEGELKNRKFLSQIKKICKNSYFIVPTSFILVNQIIHSMISYYEDRKTIKISWELSVLEVPVIDPPKLRLKELVLDLANELNKLRDKIKCIEDSIPIIIQVEREIWMGNLKDYWNFIPDFSGNKFNEKSYEEFFYSDYFSNLPSIVLISYLFGYILRERNLKSQDIVDIYAISELMPYTMLSILDKDQYNRLLLLKRDYPSLFSSLFENIFISSYHKEAPNPEKALKSFLRWCLNN